MSHVVSVASDSAHRFSKILRDRIELEAGIGVIGDAHAGPLVRHRTLVEKDPQRPNLRQVHLLHSELLERIAAQGHRADPGELGENILTADLDLLSLPLGARLHIGEAVVLEVTGLRNPCRQIERFSPGLKEMLAPRGPDGRIAERLAGVMSIVLTGGVVRPGDRIETERPAGAFRPLVVL